MQILHHKNKFLFIVNSDDRLTNMSVPENLAVAVTSVNKFNDLRNIKSG